uniref:Uncharacterized protein n=1 Tax=Siphoviridae sp. ctJj91 TaxID=2827838 RepID=A0A8S5SXX0_9CAUD|nr:MAG TPA: hypothetical protein [Siphoviridae sp. ctJj91]
MRKYSQYAMKFLFARFRGDMPPKQFAAFLQHLSHFAALVIY